MHNNFLVERSGKMSKSSGEFLRLQLLIDKGYHPLAYRMMCLQAHYRSELEFSWEGLQAAQTRLKRMVMRLSVADQPIDQQRAEEVLNDWERRFDEVMSDDLNTPSALILLEQAVVSNFQMDLKRPYIERMDAVLGLNLLTLKRTDFRIRPKAATITEAEIEAALARRKEARAAKDFATSDAIRDELAANGVEVMDGDSLGWEWKLGD
jgi:cysteinyl-tRNA synthetase